MHENDIAKQVVDAANKIHTTLGPGLLESVYETILGYELVGRGLKVTRQAAIPVAYEQLSLDEGFRADLLVEEKVIVELKSVEKVAPVHKKQLLTYLRLAEKRLGLLINFGEDPDQGRSYPDRQPPLKSSKLTQRRETRRKKAGSNEPAFYFLSWRSWRLSERI